MLSDQYITDKNLPDKAIDLIDEASAALKLSAEAMPASLVELQSEIRNKRILAQVEKNNKDIVKEIEVLQKSFDDAYLNWEKEVSALKKVTEVRSRLEKLKFDLEKAEREQNYEEASKIKYSLLPEIEAELEQSTHEWGS
jgi:ATP-dependent Clp protease ATP-binding subunit ClpB